MESPSRSIQMHESKSEPTRAIQQNVPDLTSTVAGEVDAAVVHASPFRPLCRTILSTVSISALSF
jgi:hypothetical protein